MSEWLFQYGTGSNNISGNRNGREIESAAADRLALAAGDRPLLSPEEPRRRRDRIAPALLAGDRIGLRKLVPFWNRQPELSTILFLRLASDDRAVHFDLHHDVGHRRPRSRLPFVGARRAGASVGDRYGKGVGRHDALGDSGTDLSRLRSCARRSLHARELLDRHRLRFSDGIFPDGIRIHSRLADGVSASLPRDRELIPDPTVAAFGRAVSRESRFRLDRMGDAPQSPHIRT